MRAGAEGQVTNGGGSSSTRYASRDGLILFIAVPNQRLDEYNTNLLDCSIHALERLNLRYMLVSQNPHGYLDNEHKYSIGTFMAASAFMRKFHPTWSFGILQHSVILRRAPRAEMHCDIETLGVAQPQNLGLSPGHRGMVWVRTSALW